MHPKVRLRVQQTTQHETLLRRERVNLGGGFAAVRTSGELEAGTKKIIYRDPVADHANKWGAEI
jgi:hypothetical protein